MTRSLTHEETKRIKEFIAANEETPINEIITKFEAEFNTPITVTCIRGIFIQMVMAGPTDSKGEK